MLAAGWRAPAVVAACCARGQPSASTFAKVSTATMLAVAPPPPPVTPSATASTVMLSGAPPGPCINCGTEVLDTTSGERK